MGCIFVVGGNRAQLVYRGFVLEVVWVVGKMVLGDSIHLSNMLRFYGFMVSVVLCVGICRL